MKIEKYIVAVAFLFAGSLQAQDFFELIKSMRQEYDQSKNLQVVMEITVYDSGQSVVPFYQQIADIKRAGNNYWYQVEHTEMLLNEKYLVVVDNKAKLISYSKRSLQVEAELQKSLQFNLDSVFKQYDAPGYLGKEGDADHYVVKEKKGPIGEVHFYINPEGHVLKKMAYKYRGGQYASIRFLVFDGNAKFDADTFSEARYLVEVNKKVVPSHFFKQYGLQYQ